ncbi:ABC transporter ATP-binding protein [Rhodococcus sp. HNM0563]|uniref:ABC transporter ATP-binding protein n=1 Tax=unclassified Rhodococcus (in: high G+C Gram-positive bacteria) TaxID=192944 RepID=UPI00146AE9FA|nr:MULTISPECIES: ABC transporter ATP-binding protein [unclassified Rhodococcus (in: high G+C Gram-positive bacteria)]MCK0090446.1 ABC transporter ATP-binding protein [Rhodococcus sp. F64268]NLU61653.1 ABC transporter ATP-binding protein [Rhodococcus sp. HNM0563]
MNNRDVAAIELHDVVKSFRPRGGDEVHAVDHLDVTVRRGEIVALLGPNGAGKTTTLDMVLGFTEPTTGVVSVYGKPPRHAIAAGQVSAVLQTGGLLRDLTVRETVQMIASTFPEHRDVDEVLERAGVTKLASRMVSKCSGGEQQRLRFALALLPDPDLIVLDEPTAGMDVGARREFWSTMHAEADAGRTVVFATHYLEEADAFADRIVMIADGRVVADGPTSEIRTIAAGRVVSADIAHGREDAMYAALKSHPGVADISVMGNRIEIRATDSDDVARMLLVDLGATNLEITGGSLETAFLALTEKVPA